MTIFQLTKTKVLIIFLLLLLLAFTSAYILWRQDGETPTAANQKNPLTVAFEESGAEFQELTVKSWGQVAGGECTIDELKDMYGKIEAALGKGTEITVNENEADNYKGITAQGKTAQGYDINFTIQSINDSYQEDETYLIVDLRERLDWREASKIGAVADTCFSAIDAEGETSILLSGYFQRRLNSEAKTALVKNIFNAVGGEIIEGVDNDTYISESGYCPGLPRSITSAAGEINLQVALFDDEVKNQTGIFIGTPLIFTEY